MSSGTELLWPGAALLVLLGVAASLCVRCSRPGAKRSEKIYQQRSLREDQQSFTGSQTYSLVGQAWPGPLVDTAPARKDKLLQFSPSLEGKWHRDRDRPSQAGTKANSWGDRPHAVVAAGPGKASPAETHRLGRAAWPREGAHLHMPDGGDREHSKGSDQGNTLLCLGLWSLSWVESRGQEQAMSRAFSSSRSSISQVPELQQRKQTRVGGRLRRPHCHGVLQLGAVLKAPRSHPSWA
ncbi:linker for activation of T-cells family member 2 isoform X2 [Callithrix jacchus]